MTTVLCLKRLMTVMLRGKGKQTEKEASGVLGAIDGGIYLPTILSHLPLLTGLFDHPSPLTHLGGSFIFPLYGFSGYFIKVSKLHLLLGFLFCGWLVGGGCTL